MRDKTFDDLTSFELAGNLDRTQLLVFEQIRATRRVAAALETMAAWAEENWYLAGARPKRGRS
jgi:hypothetical protein